MLALGLLLKDGLLNALLLGESDEDLVVRADDEDVLEGGGEDLASGVLEGDHVDGAGVVGVRHDLADAADGATSGDHGQSALLEDDVVEGLAGGNLDLEGVVDLHIGVHVADGTAVVEVGVGDALLADLDLAHTAELVRSLLSGDLVGLEPSFDIEHHAKVLVVLLDRDDVLETAGEGLVSADLAVNLDQLLHHNELDLIVVQSVLQAVAQQHSQGQALTQLVRTGRGLRGVDAGKLVQAPVSGGSNTLQVFLLTASLKKGRKKWEKRPNVWA